MENIDIDLQEIDIANVDSVLTGPQGPQGEPGEPGRDGISPTINIGTVTTLNAGSPATVTNVGSDSNVILDFGIPRGNQGETGEAGTDGTDGVDGITPTVTIGSTTTVSYDSPASVSNSGSSTDVILNFEIPQGIPGDDSNCLSVPTIVDSLPETGDPKKFYFIPKPVNLLTANGDSFTISIDEPAGRIRSIVIEGVLEQATPPATIYVMSGVSTVNIGTDTYTVDLGNIELAKVDDQYDYIYQDGDTWKLHKIIGKIDTYDGETINTSYVSTSGTLTTGDTVYYILDDAETTIIEDTNLTNVLNLICSTVFGNGNTSISITNANITPDITVSYYGYDPDNQYDKYVYLINTSHYEKIADDYSIYSDAEQIVGSWNGKALYRKTYHGTPTLTANNVDTITLEGVGVVDEIVSCKGRWKYYDQGSNKFYALIGNALNEGAVYSSIVQTNYASCAIRFRTTYNITSLFTVSIEYTKNLI